MMDAFEEVLLNDLRRIRAREQDTRNILRTQGGLTDEQIAERIADLERVDPCNRPARSAFTEEQFEILETAFHRVLYLFGTVCTNMDQDLRQQEALVAVLDRKGVVTDEEVWEEDEAIYRREGAIFMQAPPDGEQHSRRWRLEHSLREARALIYRILESPPELLRRARHGEE